MYSMCVYNSICIVIPKTLSFERQWNLFWRWLYPLIEEKLYSLEIF